MINNIINGWFTSLATSTLKGVVKPLIVCQLAGQNCLMNEIKQLQFIIVAPNYSYLQIWLKIVQRCRNHI